MINQQVYLDKVHGGWFGKCLGGAAGAPVEGFKCLIETRHYTETLRTDLPNDDLDLQLLWLEVLQEKGFAITARELAEAWDAKCWYPFNEYGIFLKNFARKIAPPYSGCFNNPVFCEGEGSPIRSEIWGMCFPGRPKLAAAYAAMDASLDHAGESVWIEQYYAAVEAMAFEQSDLVALLSQGLTWLPRGSRGRGCAELVLRCYAENATDWQRARTILLRQYSHNDFSNAVTNLGLTLIALLYANGSLDDVVNIAYRSGYDADCTCATAASIMGILIGYSNIDKVFQQMVQDSFVVGINVSRTNHSVAQLAKETVALGLQALTISGDLPPKTAALHLEANYLVQPAIGFDTAAEMEIVLENLSGKGVCGTLTLESDHNGFVAAPAAAEISIPAGATQRVRCCITALPSLREIPAAVVCTARYAGVQLQFGLAGAMVYRVFGPFFDPLEKEDRPGLPQPHPPGCRLPNLECMVNNHVSMEKDYAVQPDDFILLNANEDLLPMDEAFAFRGQGCFYLEQTLLCPEERDAWVVISNNDGFALWINNDLVLQKDEIRLYTPYNNYELVHLKQGKNTVRLKLLKRTDRLKFGIAYRACNGQHFHRNRWLTDLSTRID